MEDGALHENWQNFVIKKSVERKIFLKKVLNLLFRV